MRNEKHDWFQKCSNLQDYFIEKWVQSWGGEGQFFSELKKIKIQLFFKKVGATCLLSA
jgi:hypothetical protein